MSEPERTRMSIGRPGDEREQRCAHRIGRNEVGVFVDGSAAEAARDDFDRIQNEAGANLN
jgi:hypothetical protein